jgi:hypothetical protein
MASKSHQMTGVNSGNVDDAINSLANPIPTIQSAKHNSKLSISYHALRKMIQRDIEVQHIEQVLNCSGVEILENYQQGERPLPACLILGKDIHHRCLHVLVTYPIIEVVTTYEPTMPKWINPRQRSGK